MSKKPLKSTFSVGACTLVSRIFGYLRDAVIFVVFGANAATDAFFVAFRISNFLRRLFAEGAFSQAFIPVMSAELEQSEARFHRLIDHVCGLLALMLLFITLIGILLSPWLIHLFAPGFKDPQQHLLASDLLTITFPYLFFISLTALAGSILNIRQRFAVPALTPAFLNIALILAAVWLAPNMDQPVTALAWGVFIAGLTQLAFQIPFLIAANALPQPKLSGATAAVRRILKLMLPAIFGSSIVQINVLINTMIASYLVVGSISWLYISDRFVELPLALFGIATATVILPMLSKQYVASQHRQFDQTLQWAMKLSLLVSIPAMLGLAALSFAILSTLVQYREFTSLDAHMSALSLMAYAFGLPAFIYIKVLAPGFYARQDTKTPVKIGLVTILINVVLNGFFLWLWSQLQLPAAHAGLALATSIAAYVNAGLLFMLLKRAQVLKPLKNWSALLLKVLLGASGMLALLLWLTPPPAVWSEWPGPQRFAILCALVGAGLTAYSLTLLALGIRPRQFRFTPKPG